jgi:hypothetical protein
MPSITRTLRSFTGVALAALFVMPALAAAQTQAAGSATTGDEYCMYPRAKTDTPEIGPLPCDTSRPYMIGHSNLGSSRIPENSEYNTGPKSHLNPDGSVPAAVDSSDHVDGTSASPSSDLGANSYHVPDVEAP